MITGIRKHDSVQLGRGNNGQRILPQQPTEQQRSRSLSFLISLSFFLSFIHIIRLLPLPCSVACVSPTKKKKCHRARSFPCHTLGRANGHHPTQTGPNSTFPSHTSFPPPPSFFFFFFVTRVVCGSRQGARQRGGARAGPGGAHGQLLCPMASSASAAPRPGRPPAPRMTARSAHRITARFSLFCSGNGEPVLVLLVVVLAAVRDLALQVVRHGARRAPPGVK